MSAHAIDIAGLYVAKPGLLKRLVRRVVGSRTTAEDLVQQTFVKLIDNADHGNVADVPAYLATTARHLALNRWPISTGVSGQNNFRRTILICAFSSVIIKRGSRFAPNPVSKRLPPCQEWATQDESTDPVVLEALEWFVRMRDEKWSMPRIA